MPAVPEETVGALGFPPLQSQLLYNRGLDSRAEAQSFLSPDKSEVCDPMLLPDMEKAVSRLRRAIEDKERIGVFGDFDIDGISGSAVVMSGLGKLGADVVPYLPDRATEGHGLNPTAIRELAEKGVSVLVTVDCGADSDTEVEFASSVGIDSIITDHHTIFDDPPYPVLALINPKRPDSEYPFNHLTGVGMAYKLIQAIYADAGLDSPENLLELVALGTVGDVGPLVGENRYFVSEGMRRINRTVNSGLKALLDVSGYSGKDVDTTALSFGLIPRLNAPGRLDDAMISLELLTTSDLERARSIAALIDQFNTRRQMLTAKCVTQAEAQIEKRWGRSLPGIIMVGRKDWQPGLLGLIAARLVETYDRPAIAVAVGESYSRASARSVPNFDILDPIKRRSDLLDKFGGHKQAAGFTMSNDGLRTLADHFESVSEGVFATSAVDARLDIDMAAGPSLVAKDLFDFTRKLAPFGESNPQPLFASGPLRVVNSIGVGSGKHLKLSLQDSDGSTWDSIAFRQGKRIGDAKPGSHLEVAYKMELNTWRNVTNLQLVVEDFSPSAQA